jgi:hypothetical protein
MTRAGPDPQMQASATAESVLCDPTRRGLVTACGIEHGTAAGQAHSPSPVADSAPLADHGPERHRQALVGAVVGQYASWPGLVRQGLVAQMNAIFATQLPHCRTSIPGYETRCRVEVGASARLRASKWSALSRARNRPTNRYRCRIDPRRPCPDPQPSVPPAVQRGQEADQHKQHLCWSGALRDLVGRLRGSPHKAGSEALTVARQQTTVNNASHPRR